jgi:hypothetical protein
MVQRETIKRGLDECACDWCGRMLQEGDPAYIDLNHGTAYCSEACAEQDAFDADYGSVCPGVNYW